VGVDRPRFQDPIPAPEDAQHYAFGIDVATSGTTSIIGLYNEDKKWYVCFMIDLQGAQHL
jgi:hypothetical protein